MIYTDPKTGEQKVDYSPNFTTTSDAKADMYNSSWQKLQQAMPKRPVYDSGLDAKTGLLKNKNLNLQAGPDVTMGSNLGGLQDKLNGINLNTQGLEAMRKYATGTGLSPWAMGQMQTQGLNEANARDQNQKLGATADNTAQNNLMMTGGFGGGAAERVARMGARATNAGAQTVARQGALDRSGISTQDESNRLDLLKQLPGAEVQALEPELKKTSMWGDLANSENQQKTALALSNRSFDSDVNKFNIGNALQAKQGNDANNLASYQELMKAWGANRTADAQQKSGK